MAEKLKCKRQETIYSINNRFVIHLYILLKLFENTQCYKYIKLVIFINLVILVSWKIFFFSLFHIKRTLKLITRHWYYNKSIVTRNDQTTESYAFMGKLNSAKMQSFARGTSAKIEIHVIRSGYISSIVYLYKFPV